MKKNGLAKVFAIFALVWIVISVIWTWVLVLMSSNQEPQTYTAEEMKDFIRMSTWTTSTWIVEPPLEVEGNVEVVTNSWDTLIDETVIEEVKTNTWEVK